MGYVSQTMRDELWFGIFGLGQLDQVRLVVQLCWVWAALLVQVRWIRRVALLLMGYVSQTMRDELQFGLVGLDQGSSKTGNLSIP